MKINSLLTHIVCHKKSKKAFRVMKMTFLLILVFASHLFAVKGEAQNAIVEFRSNNLSIEELFKEIEQQTDYLIIYSTSEIRSNFNVTLSKKKAKVSEILDEVLSGRKLKYEFTENYIVLSESSPDGMPQQGKRKISGNIKDEYGSPVIGANVVEKGTTNGTITNVDGDFNLTVSDHAVLVISYIGYEAREVSVKNQQTMDIVLREDTEALEEVVVVGYGTQKKENLTGAVDVINKESLSQRSSGNLSQSIRGLAPSMNFSLNSAGFQPGADMDVSIRGIGSLNGGSPYVLIDGFPGDMNLVNPEDVESISVLKDAAASAIYGSRAPYGVILITTKSGKKSEKMSITYSGMMMINSPQKLPKSLDSYTYSRVQNEAGRNLGGAPMSESAIDRIIAFQNGDWDELRRLMPNYPAGADITSGAYPNGDTWDSANLNYADNDWWDILFGSSVNQKHDVSLQGGTEKASYYFSGGYLDQKGVLNYGKDVFRRFNLLGKMNIAITDFFDVSWETRFSQKYRERSSHWNGADYTNTFKYVTRWLYPFSPLYDGWGNISRASMLPFVLSGTETSKNLDYWNNLRAEIRPLKGWKINVDFAYNTQSYNTSNLHREAIAYTVDNKPYAAAETNPNNLTKQKYDNYYWNTNIYTTYTFNIKNEHNFSVMAGMQLEKGMNDQISAYKTNLIVEDIPAFQTATGAITLSDILGHNATQGYFGRINYNYKEKYLLETNMRYDGSYVFRQGNRWGFFPSASIGWSVHRESFWKHVQPYVNTLKIKASWGQLGNQNVNPYTDLSLIPLQTGKLNWIFEPTGGRRIGYTTAPEIVNRHLTWETAATTNLGLETSFFDNRLQATVDLFERRTTDMVGPSESKPGVLGANAPKMNNATLRTRGWEISLNWKHTINKDFSYFVNLNLSDYRSVVTKYNNPTGTLSTWYEGQEVGDIWGYTVHDLFRTQAELDDYLSKKDLSFLGATWRTGDVKFEDTDNNDKVNNGKNTVSDHGDLSVIGNDQPHYIFGIMPGFSYKGLDFSMLWSGVMKRDVFFNSDANLYWGFHSMWWEGNLQPRNLDYFRDEPGTKYVGLYEGDANINTDAFWPRPYLNGTEIDKNYSHPNTRYLANAAYIRMQNIQLGYTFPKKWTSKIKLEKVRIYFSGDNLLTFTSLPNGVDPEIPNNANLTYGADRVCSFGITVSY